MKTLLAVVAIVLLSSVAEAQYPYQYQVYGTARISPFGNRMTYNFSNGLYGTARLNPLGNRVDFNFNNGSYGTARIRGNRIDYNFYGPIGPPNPADILSLPQFGQ